MQPSSLTRFFWFCSGANPDALLQCPRSEHIKYVGVGATVFFTSVLATLSGGYAFFTVFNSQVFAVLFGLLWGFIIFNLDRFIVSTIKKEGSKQQQFMMAIPRIGLAILLAIVIAKPLELRIFQSEINEILNDRKREKIALIQGDFEAQTLLLETKIATLKSATETLRTAREKDYQDYKCECDGTCGTGKRGRGSECERKEIKYLKSDREYQAAKQENDLEVISIQGEISALKTNRTTAMSKAEASFSQGLVARLSASSELPQKPTLFLSLLILFIELSPVLAKLLSPRGPYDDLQKQTEQAFLLDRIQELKEKKISQAKQVELLQHLQSLEVQQELKRRQQTSKAVNDAKLELVRDEIDKWLEAEKAKRKDT